MPYLLDGNNLVGRERRTSRPSAEDRAALVSEIAERLRRTRATATIFFDGPSGAGTGTLGRLRVRGSEGRSADDAIVGEILRSRSPGEFIVVTADRELARRCRDAGARTCPPAEFFSRFGRGTAGAPSEKPEAVDLEDWTRYFGDEGNRS
jgi:hypothetical protein